MVTLAAIDEQLKRANCTVRVWGRSEVRELCDILLPGETIYQAVNGQYEAGFGMLVATDFRILLVDKKPKYLTLKDIRFDMITELDFAARLVDSTIRIHTPNRELKFTAFNNSKMRKLFSHTQHKVMEIRNHYLMQQFQHFQQQQLAQNTPPGIAMIQQQEELQQRYNNAIDVNAVSSSSQPFQHGGLHGILDSSEEQVKLAAAMGAAGLKSIVHNGRVFKDYMAVPFQQRWRRRPYGYTNTPVAGPQ
jgi:hypothetical protein